MERWRSYLINYSWAMIMAAMEVLGATVGFLEEPRQMERVYKAENRQFFQNELFLG